MINDMQHVVLVVVIAYTHASTAARWEDNTCWRRLHVWISLFICALCQEYRELQNPGFDITIWTLNNLICIFFGLNYIDFIWKYMQIWWTNVFHLKMTIRVGGKCWEMTIRQGTNCSSTSTYDSLRNNQDH